MRSSRLFLRLGAPLLVLAVIVFASFSRTIGSYFLEDDFGEVRYVSEIFSGNWQKIISNFTGNFMEIPTMKVYRPCLLLSLIADYAVWGTRAYGYFITNIIFLLAAAMMLYLVLKELTKSWDRPRSILFTIFSAALFASSPLHCESVSLMVGRVDIICAFFYLLALWCFVRKGDNNNWMLTLLGVLSFWIALLTKEMAIGLPLLLAAIGFLFPDVLMKQAKNAGVFTGERIKRNLYKRLVLAIKVSYPLWISCLFYFVIRFLALGTIFGGYVGSVGASQFGHIFQKWADGDTIHRIIFPLSKAVFAEHDFFHSGLFFIYFFLLILVFARLVISGIPRVWLALIAVWIVTTLVPIYQLWGLGFNLEGARFLFFLTMPLSLIVPLLLFAPSTTENSHNAFNSPQSDIGAGEIRMLAPGVIALLLLVVLNTTIAAKNNIPWVHAGGQTRAILQEGQNLARNLGNNEKIVVLGIPKQVDGAHIIYNGITFDFMMSPPFSKENYANKFITFDPIFFGNPDLINTARFKQTLLSSDIVGCYVWRSDHKTFEKLILPAQKELAQKELAQTNSPLILPLPDPKNILLPFTEHRGSWQINSNSIDIQHCEKGSGIAIAPIPIDPFIYDYMEIEAAINPVIHPEQLSVSWFTDCSDVRETDSVANGLSAHLKASPVTNEGTVNQIPTQETSEKKEPTPAKDVLNEYKTYRIALSRHWRWFTGGRLNKLCLEFPPAQSIFIKGIRLINAISLVPKVSINDLEADNTGVYAVKNAEFFCSIDGSLVENCAGLKIEFSKPNYFFENFDTNSKDAVLSELVLNGASTKQSINRSVFPSRAYYQIRAICLNKNGNTEGEWTDPVTIRIE